MVILMLCADGKIYSWGKSSRGRLGRDWRSDENGDPSLVSVNTAAAAASAAGDVDEDAGVGSREVTSLCCSHGISLVCLTQRNRLSATSSFTVAILNLENSRYLTLVGASRRN